MLIKGGGVFGFKKEVQILPKWRLLKDADADLHSQIESNLNPDSVEQERIPAKKMNILSYLTIYSC